MSNSAYLCQSNLFQVKSNFGDFLVCQRCLHGRLPSSPSLSGPCAYRTAAGPSLGHLWLHRESRWGALFWLDSATVLDIESLHPSTLGELNVTHSRDPANVWNLEKRRSHSSSEFRRKFVSLNHRASAMLLEYPMERGQEPDGCSLCQSDTFFFFFGSSANIQQLASPFTAGVSWRCRPDQLTRLQLSLIHIWRCRRRG